jgi:hypothetical protein
LELTRRRLKWRWREKGVSERREGLKGGGEVEGHGGVEWKIRDEERSGGESVLFLSLGSDEEEVSDDRE